MKTTECITWIIILLEIVLFDQTCQTEAAWRSLPQKQASHLACKCPLGFYGRGKLVIFAHTDICKGENGDLGEDNQGTMLKSIFRPGSDTDEDGPTGSSQKDGQEGMFFVRMEMCHSCAVGCAKCSGPTEADCSQCLPGYYANFHRKDVPVQAERRSPQSTEPLASRSKRSPSSVKPRNSGPLGILEEEELLLTDSTTNSSSSDRPTSKPVANSRPDDGAYESSGDTDDGGEDELGYRPKEAPQQEVHTSSSPPVTQPEPEVPLTAMDVSKKTAPIDVSIYYYNEDDVTDHEEDADFQYDYDPSEDRRVGADRTHTQSDLNADRHLGQSFGGTIDPPVESTSNATRSAENEATTSGTVAAKSEGPMVGPTRTDPPSRTNTVGDPSLVPITTTLPGMNPVTDTPTEPVPFSCVAVCPIGFFPDGDRGVCVSCHPECVGCTGDGPDQCIECLHFRLGSTCLTPCNGSGSDQPNCSFGLKDSEEEALSDGGEESIPAGYYAIPPVTILVVSGAIMICYYRRHRKLQGSYHWKADERYRKASIRPNDDHSHLDHKKCYYKNGKTPPHMYALTEFRHSPDPTKRPGNPYVYAERPLIQKHGYPSATNSPAWSVGRDMSEDEEFDPLYETPDNTMDMDALRRYHQRRRSSPIPKHHHLAPALKYKEVSKSWDDCHHGLGNRPIKESVARHTSSMEATQHIV